jgi:hypothetical protein
MKTLRTQSTVYPDEPIKNHLTWRVYIRTRLTNLGLVNKFRKNEFRKEISRATQRVIK